MLRRTATDICVEIIWWIGCLGRVVRIVFAAVSANKYFQNRFQNNYIEYVKDNNLKNMYVVQLFLDNLVKEAAESCIDKTEKNNSYSYKKEQQVSPLKQTKEDALYKTKKREYLRNYRHWDTVRSGELINNIKRKQLYKLPKHQKSLTINCQGPSMLKALTR